MTRSTGEASGACPTGRSALILIVVVGVGSVFAYTKKLPWADPYEVQAVFETAQNLRPKAPVRIAGIQVGEVTKVEHLTDDDPALQADATGDADNPLPDDATSGQQAALVTMTLKRGGPAAARRRDRSSCAPACSWRATCSSTPSPEARTPRPTEEGHTFPVNADLDLGPDRPGPDDAAVRRAGQPADLPRPVRQRPDRVRRRGEAPRALPLVPRRLQVHVDRQRGAAGNRSRTTSRA